MIVTEKSSHCAKSHSKLTGHMGKRGLEQGTPSVLNFITRTPIKLVITPIKITASLNRHGTFPVSKKGYINEGCFLKNSEGKMSQQCLEEAAARASKESMCPDRARERVLGLATLKAVLKSLVVCCVYLCVSSSVT
jgi:hypothetical protein